MSTAYEDHIDALKEIYEPRALAILSKIADGAKEHGLWACEPYELSDDEYRWSVCVARTEENCEIPVDITLMIVEERVHEGGVGEGISFSLDIVEWGGRILGGLSPGNYTPDWVVDSRDQEAVEDRFKIIEDANMNEAIEMIVDSIARQTGEETS